MTRTIVLATLLAAAATPALAGIANFTATLNAAQEVPTNASTATGTAKLAIDTDLNTLTIDLDVTGLFATTAAGELSGLADGHIHAPVNPALPSGPGFNSPVAIGFPGLPLGSTSFSYDRVINLADPMVYRAAFLGANGGTALGARDALLDYLSSGRAYVNVHSTRFPGGEIRGDVSVPAPAALALFGLGVAGIAAARRRTDGFGDQFDVALGLEQVGPLLVENEAQCVGARVGLE